MDDTPQSNRNEDPVTPKPGAPNDRSEADHQTALDISRGTERLFTDMGLSSIREFSLTTGRRVDVAALAKDGTITFVEIKSSLADFRSDQKWPEYLEFCDQFFFAVAPDFPRGVLPADQGLIIADRYGAEVLRPDPSTRKIVAARRKAVTLRFARAAATRLTTFLWDTENEL